MELFDDLLASCEADPIYRPLLAFLRARKAHRAAPPYIPRWDAMALSKLCKLALLWQEAGFTSEAGELSSWLQKLERFPSLWCLEKEFDLETLKKLFSEIRPLATGVCEKKEADLTLIETAHLSAALTLDGKGTSLGAIHADPFQIRSFGPQDKALTFGIQGKGMDGWVCASADPEVWLTMKHEIREEKIQLDLRFIGIKQENPLFFAFYVKAERCQVGELLLKPKNLTRFQGEAKQVLFDQRWGIEAINPWPLQIIPLAGEGCYWDTDFLLLFDIPCFSSQISFLLG